MGKTSFDRRWLPLNALRAFEGVAKHSSFTAAANALLLRVRIRAEEAALGVRPHAN